MVANRRRENLCNYLHALAHMLDAVKRQSGDADESVALRDQFLEGIRDVSLRGNSRNVSEKNHRLLSFRSVMKPSPGSGGRGMALPFVRSKSIEVPPDSDSSAHCTVVNTNQQKTTTLDDVIRVIADQGRVIGNSPKQSGIWPHKKRKNLAKEMKHTKHILG